jgi:hypothetical protein
MTLDEFLNDDGKEKEPWTFEHFFYLKRNFLGAVNFDDQPHIIRSIRKRIANLANILGLSKSNTMLEIFFAGLELLEAEIETGKRDKVNVTIGEDARQYVIAKKIAEITEHKTRLQELSEIQKEMGMVKFVDWCKKNDIDYEDLFRHLPQISLKDSDRLRSWLFSHLDGKGEVKTSKIKEAAYSEGIIHDPKGWGRMSKIAARMGTTGGKHGYWQLPAKGQNDEKTDMH